MLRLLERSREQQVGVPSLRSTDYINTIPPEREPWFPGDEHVERRIRAYIRWNAAIMVHRAQRPGIAVGGHISSYASSASLYEVGFNHFFRGKDHPGGGDQIWFQGHASPGIYARAFLEGRLTEQQLDGFRQEVSHPGGGLSSYPHPRLMPEFWEFPTVSMGLGPINAIYQARFNRYLHDRGIKDTSDQHVWAFLGDGEMDEPESLGAIGLAAREELDNLTFVVNCNLQRLDGPVRGNGKVIQELESFFRGAGWNVIKVIWGREWDALLAADRDGALVNLMNQTPDGDYQTYKAEDGAFVREHFFGRDPRTRKMVEDLQRQGDLGPLPRRPRLPQGLRGVQGGAGAQGPADGHPRQDDQGLDAGQPLRGPQLHAPDEEADRRGPRRLPRPALPGHPRLGAGQDPAALLQARARVRRAAVHARAAPAARWRRAAPPVGVQAAQGPRRQGARRPAPRVGQAGGGDDDGVRPPAEGAAQGQGARPAVRADHPRRGPHLRPGLPVLARTRSTTRPASATPRSTAS